MHYIDYFHSKNGHNFLGDNNYYVTSEDVYEKVKGEIPYRVGVYVPKKKSHWEEKAERIGKSSKAIRVKK